MTSLTERGPARGVVAPLALVLLAALGGTPARATVCPNPPLPPAGSELCTAIAGDAGRLLRGTVLVPGDALVNGHLLIAADGTISCAGCDCSATPGFPTATRLDCPDGVISPGRIDSLDFVQFDHNAPFDDDGERYEHRHDWRLGQNGHAELPPATSGSNDARTWNELRHVLAGTTAVIGVVGRPGWVRNLDVPSLLEGLASTAFDRETFPLGDAGGERLVGSCAYPQLPAPAAGTPYAPILDEGIDASARNELLCVSGGQPGSVDVIDGAVVGHAIALAGLDGAALADRDATVAWSPRNDLRLYGATTPVAMLERAGVPVALGTSWTPTGSMSLERELACADEYNRRYLVGRLSDRALLEAATSVAATAGGMDDEIGAIVAGREADVTVFAAAGREPFRAAIEARAGEVALVLRGGVALVGEPVAMDALGATAPGCETELDVCGRTLRLCTVRESALPFSTLAASNVGSYPLFFCGSVPVDEPTCVPRRPAGFFGTHAYTGDRTAGDLDGDGFANAADRCPVVLDPPLVQADVQLDTDGDGDGDACDFCPTSASATGCGEISEVALSVALGAPAVRLVESRLAMTVAAQNAGPATALARIVLPMLRELEIASWDCAATGGSSCLPASGTGGLDAVASMPPGSSVTFTAIARLPLGSPPTFVHNAAVLPHATHGDADAQDNYTGAVTVVLPFDGQFLDGFESGDTLAWSFETP